MVSEIYEENLYNQIALLQAQISELKQENQLMRNRALQAEQILKSILDYVPEGITIADAPDVSIRIINKFGTQFISISSEQSIEIPSGFHVENWQMYHPDGLKLAKPEELPLYRATKKGEIVIDEEWIMRQPDGKNITILCNAGPITNEHNEITGGVFAWRDISDTKIAEDALQESIELFHSAVESIPDIFIIYDAELRVQYINPAGLRIIQKPLSDLIGKQADDLFSSDVTSQYLPSLREALDTLAPQSCELVLSLPDHTNHILQVTFVPLTDVSGKIKRIFSVSFDVTDYRRVVAELRQRVREIETIMDVAPVAILVAEDPACNFMIGNRKANEIFCTEMGANLSQTPPPGEDIPRYRYLISGRELSPEELPIQYAASHNVEVRDVELEAVHPDGSRYFFYGNASPVQDEQGQVRGSVGAFMEISELKHVQQELMRATERFKLLSNSASQLLMNTEPHQIIYQICQEVMLQLDCQVFFNYLVDWESKHMHLHAFSGVTHELANRLEWLDLSNAICGCAAELGERMVVNDVQDTNDPKLEHIRSCGIKAYACHPWISRDGIILGTLSFGTCTHNSFSEDELSIMKIISDYMAVAMDRKRTRDQLRSLNETLEKKVRERTETLMNNQEQLRQLVLELSRTEQREKKRLAAILHDYLAQMLVVCKLKMERLKRQKLSDSIEKIVIDVIDTLGESLNYTRNLMAELSPRVIYDEGLVPALNWLARQMENHGLQVTVEDDQSVIELTEDQSIILFQTVRELLINVLKHAQISEANVRIRKQADGLYITVRDFGIGFDLSDETKTQGQEGHFGLFHIHERLEALSGQCEVYSAPGQGTEVVLFIPLE